MRKKGKSRVAQIIAFSSWKGESRWRGGKENQIKIARTREERVEGGGWRLSGVNGEIWRACGPWLQGDRVMG